MFHGCEIEKHRTTLSFPCRERQGVRPSCLQTRLHLPQSGYVETTMDSSRGSKTSQEGNRGEPALDTLLGVSHLVGGFLVLALVRHVFTATIAFEGRIRRPHDLPPRRGSHPTRQDALPRLLH